MWTLDLVQRERLFEKLGGGEPGTQMLKKMAAPAHTEGSSYDRLMTKILAHISEKKG
jgi:hypothetical protein